MQCGLLSVATDFHKGNLMKVTVKVDVKIDVAACLQVLAAIILIVT